MREPLIERTYLVITQLFLPTKGGTPVWYDAVYRRIGRKNIHIVTAHVEGDQEHDATNPNSLYRVNLHRYAWLRPESLWLYLKLFGVSLWVGLRHRADIVHAARALPEGLVGWVVSRLLRRPLIVYCHGEELTTWGKGRKFRAMAFVFRQSNAVIVNSEYTRVETAKLVDDPSHIRLILPGVDVSLFYPRGSAERVRDALGVAPTTKLILSVGRLQRRKGFDQVIRAVNKLRSEGIDAFYAMIGNGEDGTYLKGLIDELDLNSQVRLIGPVETAELPDWYSACDVFAMPNREIDGDTEGFGIVFLEAGACAKPVVAGRAGGTGSAVLDGTTGRRVDGSSVDAVADALREILLDDALAARWGAAAQQRVQQKFSWDRVAEATIKIDQAVTQ